MRYYRNAKLKNSFNLPSVAKEIWFPETFTELKDIYTSAMKILGSGTNIVMNKTIDKVISLKKNVAICCRNNNNYIVPANYNLTSFINTMIKDGYSGYENLIGIPGSIGGAITMNAGSGEQTISDNLFIINTFSPTYGYELFYKSDLNFKRRHSSIQGNDRIIISAIFNNKRSGIDKNKIKKTLEYRKAFPKKPSAGGLFVNWHDLLPYEKEIRNLKLKNLEFKDSINVLFNKGNATFDEVLDCIDKIKSIVPKKLVLETKIWRD